MPLKTYYISAATNNIIQQNINYYIEYYSKKYKVEEALIRAIIKKESDFETNAIRYEPGLMKDVPTNAWYRRLLTKEEQKDPYCFSSAGLMQTLYGIAKIYGFKGTVFNLFNPKYGIAYGVLHYKKIADRYNNIKDAISAYNQGTNRKRDNGEYHNQGYVNLVIKYYKEYGGKIKL